MQPSPPPSLFQHLKTCELEPATVSHGVPWRTQNFCIKTQVKTYLYGTGILSSSALGCSMCLTSYCNNTVTRKDKFKSTELKFLVLLVWSVLKKKKKKVGQTSATSWSFTISALEKSWGSVHQQPNVFNTGIVLYSENSPNHKTSFLPLTFLEATKLTFK